MTSKIKNKHTQNQVLVFDLDNTLLLRDEAMLNCLESLFNLQLSSSQRQAIQLKDKQGHSDRFIFCTWLQIYLQIPLSVSAIWAQIRENIGFFVRLNEGVITTLQQLKKHYELVLLTNGGTSNQQRKIKQTGLGAFFTSDKLFISEAIGFSKPDPRVFQVVQNQFTPDTQFCMIGDHWEKDIVGAIRFGWKAIYLNSNNFQKSELLLSSQLSSSQAANIHIIPSISSLTKKYKPRS